MKDFSHLEGHRFPGGTYTLPEYLAWLWADVVGGEPGADVAHPGLAYFAAIQGCGVSIQEIFDLMEADAASGVVFGEEILELSRPLRPGATYEVQGEITEVVRKSGKRAGVFDRLSFAISLKGEASGEPVATSTSIWIFPRKEDG